MVELPPDIEPNAAQTTEDAQDTVIRSAALLSVGNIIGRMLGLFSSTVMNGLFGAELVAAYEKAALIPLTLREMIIGGMVDSSLVPVFSDLAEKDQKELLWTGVSVFLSLSVVVLTAVVLAVEIGYRPIATAVGVYEFKNPDLIAPSIRMMRIAAPALLFFSISSILSSVLYALKRFTVPAFLTTVFNGTVVIAALFNPNRVEALAVGMLIGAVLQVAVQIPVLRDANLYWRFDPRHPLLKRILQLYTPVIGGLVVNAIVVALSFNLATRTGDASQTYMRNAARLIQFPDGLIVTALSIAILPTLSRQAANIAQFKPSLADGIKLVLVLILPATAGLFALAHPIVDLLFGNGAFTSADVEATTTVLQLYLLGLPFAGVDRMLVFGSYARNDTLRPSLIGIVSLLINAAVAILLLDALGLYSLMAADVVKHLVHTALMIWLLRRQIGGLAGYGIGLTALKSTVAAAATGVAAWFVAGWLASALATSFVSELIVVAVSGAVGVAVYLLFVFVFDISEVKQLVQRVRRR